MKKLNQYILEKFKISKEYKEITLDDIEEIINNYFEKNWKDISYNIYINSDRQGLSSVYSDPAKDIEDINDITIQINVTNQRNTIYKISDDLFKVINNIYPLKSVFTDGNSLIYYPKNEKD